MSLARLHCHSPHGSGDAPHGLSGQLRPAAELPQQLLRLRLASLRHVERRRARGRGIGPLPAPAPPARASREGGEDRTIDEVVSS